MVLRRCIQGGATFKNLRFPSTQMKSRVLVFLLFSPSSSFTFTLLHSGMVIIFVCGASSKIKDLK
jgi:hypothetical protein